MLRRRSAQEAPTAPPTPDALTQLVGHFQDEMNRQLEAGNEDFDDAFRQGFAAVGQVILQQHLADMPAEDFLALYEAVSGKEDLANHLEDWKSLKALELARAVAMGRLRKEAIVERHLRLANIPQDEVITVGLFDPKYPTKAAHAYADDGAVGSLMRVVQVRVVDPAGGLVDMLSARWAGGIWHDEYRIPDERIIQRVRLGTERRTGDGVELDPTINLHMALSYRATEGDALITHPAIIGYVVTGDGQLLLDGNQK